MGRISRKDKIERFDDEMIKLAISLDKQSKTSKYLSALFDAYEEKEVNVEDPVVAFALESQQEKIKAYVEQQKALHEKRSKAGTIGMQKRWNEQNWQTDSKTTFANDASIYPFEEFWNAYNYIKNQKGTSDIWRMMPDEDRKAAIEAVPKYLKWYENEKKRNPKLTKIYPKTFLLDRRFMDDFTIEEVTQTNTNNYGSNNGKSYKEAEFERNARTAIENLQAAERGELAYLSPFNPPSGQH